MNHTRLRILQQMPVFGGLNVDTLHNILHLSPNLTIKEGSFFFHEEQKGGSMYVLEQGKVAVLKTWEGQCHVLAYLGVGDCFGEMELLDLSPRAASVMAITDCTAIQISTANLFRLYKENLEQFTLIQMNMGREISRRLRQLDQELFAMQVDAQANHALINAFPNRSGSESANRPGKPWKVSGGSAVNV